jgi:hypothetical protein
MYSDDDPFLTELREICLALPQAIEKEAWGRPTFRAGAKGKMFAIFEGNDEHPYCVAFLPEPDERPALLEDARFFVPKYHGPYGWLSLDLTKRKKVDWGEVAELMESSYRQVAKATLLQALDAAAEG